jgi:hypothetical protein
MHLAFKKTQICYNKNIRSYWVMKMEERATALIRKCIILAYVAKWIEHETPFLNRFLSGQLSLILLNQIHQESLDEIVYLKAIMRRKAIRVIEKRSLPDSIWVKYREGNLLHEADYPKCILITDVELLIQARLKLLVSGEGNG